MPPRVTSHTYAIGDNLTRQPALRQLAPPNDIREQRVTVLAYSTRYATHVYLRDRDTGREFWTFDLYYVYDERG